MQAARIRVPNFRFNTVSPWGWIYLLKDLKVNLYIVSRLNRGSTIKNALYTWIF